MPDLTSFPLIPCSSASQFLELISKSRIVDGPSAIYTAGLVGQGGMIFRGQSDAEKELIPSALRKGSALWKYSSSSPGVGPNGGSDIGAYIWNQMIGETDAIALFLDSADRLGIDVPLDRNAIDLARSFLVKGWVDARMSRKIDPCEKFPPSALLEGAALAQHHGVPTRLLDWTESPLMAAYFAAVKASEVVRDPEKRKTTGRFAVFCLDTSFRPGVRLPFEIVVPQRSRNTYLHAQKGLFTHIPNYNDYLLQNGRWPSLEDVLIQIPECLHTLEKYTLEAKYGTEVLRLLFDLGITRETVMPSLDHAALAYDYRSALLGSLGAVDTKTTE